MQTVYRKCDKVFKQRIARVAAGALLLLPFLVAEPASAASPEPTPTSVGVLAPDSVDTSGPVLKSPGGHALPVRHAADKQIKVDPNKGKAIYKGRPGLNKATKNSTSSGSAPAASGSAAALGLYYFYGNGEQTQTSDGIYVRTTINRPWVDPNKDYHSLMELASEDSTNKQIVEVGWTVDKVQFGDNDPHAFVYWWKNGLGQCYNGCGFIDNSANPLNVGANLSSYVTSPLTSLVFELWHYNGAWWVAIGDDWIGHFDDSNWTTVAPVATSPFTQNVRGLAFAEVAAGTTKPCTDMGSGVFGTAANSATSARQGSWSLVPSTAGTSALTIFPTPSSESPTAYQVTPASTANRTFYVGGPGWNAAGTGTGIVGGC